MKSFNYLVVNDIHTGHKHTPVHVLIENYYKMRETYQREFESLDAIFILGDIFDKLLSTASVEYKLTIEWICGIASYCAKNNIKLRILEGTPSHDMGQPAIFAGIFKSAGIKVDYKYFDTIEVEYIEEYDKHILYIPDEILPSATEIETAVSKKLATLGLEKVDLTMMHGMFGYQLHFESDHKHDEAYYLSITKGLIHIGHIHKASQLDRIVAGGSFDRLAHNEEEEKGMVYVSYSAITKDYIHRRLINTYAVPYITIDIKDTIKPDMLYKRIRHALKKHKRQSPAYIRLRVDGDKKTITQYATELKEKYPEVLFKYVDGKDTDDTERQIQTSTIEINQFAITPNNIVKLLLDRGDYTSEEINLLREECVDIGLPMTWY